ncbi:MAG: hypothetical protein N3E51_05085 [Candidatus Micrarchaeota archaeon]|nr:hypothetical protein [Candidatus Micrarchaeota archaeon]
MPRRKKRRARSARAMGRKRARKKAALPAPAKKETFVLDYPKEKPPAKPAAEPQEPLKLQPLPSENVVRKRRMPHALSAIAGALVLSVLFATFFYYGLGADALLSAGVSLPLFVGFSILFYNMLEERR